MKGSVIGLFAFTFCGQLISLLYDASGVSLPGAFEALYPIAFIGVVGWWFAEDCREHNVSWPLDMGMLLFASWPFILPYHLFKTRGRRGFIGILGFIGSYIAAWVVAVIVVNI